MNEEVVAKRVLSFVSQISVRSWHSKNVRVDFDLSLLLVNIYEVYEAYWNGESFRFKKKINFSMDAYIFSRICIHFENMFAYNHKCFMTVEFSSITRYWFVSFSTDIPHLNFNISEFITFIYPKRNDNVRTEKNKSICILIVENVTDAFASAKIWLCKIDIELCLFLARASVENSFFERKEKEKCEK